MQQAQDFLDECRSLETLLRSLEADAFETPTDFKAWTFNNILRHLHVWNEAADLSLRDADAFRAWWKTAMAALAEGPFTAFESDQLKGASGVALLDIWAEAYRQIAARFAAADPSQRVEWAGPSMSARSSITARLMETWAHGQAIYDALGVTRINADRIENIVIMGLNTYGWTFQNRGLQPPEPRPFLKLTAPSGAIWTYGEDTGSEAITGDAEAFCQVVAQTRNVADTDLVVTGPNATQWMSMAQCFAGPPVEPPPPGVRAPRTKPSTTS